VISTRELLGQRADRPPDCNGSGSAVWADDQGPQYQDVTCPTCERQFTVRIARTRNGKKLPQPTKTVPRHRAAQET
jgi:hypothetical protein